MYIDSSESIDVNHFKKVNDTYGHLTGDKVLQSLALILKNECEEEAVIARYGGMIV